ncbi:hypothetical protein [Streptomyces eurocidicus]|uniref:Uncharacterized protein n=1 Tax=Streptomyces eurocidicus TaxID=66423 RepID=A0A7W8F375_STREU|nr:hypothetical protein [Streptomyces eurocidicus]MBB5118981.1 hypothetical protein [Streptomyces eurocidicus]MBF6051212.1 hypothetical protein [Streptomyces eurocidicus]
MTAGHAPARTGRLTAPHRDPHRDPHPPDAERPRGHLHAVTWRAVNFWR